MRSPWPTSGPCSPSRGPAGTGVNGSIASGSFTVADTQLAPGDFSSGGVYYNFSLTISNIPGGGPTSFTSGLSDMNSSWLDIDPSGAAYVGPYGGKGYGPPEENHYDLGQPSQLPSFIYQNALTYNGFARDLMTWSVASPIAVPEPGSAPLLLVAIIVGGLWLKSPLKTAS